MRKILLFLFVLILYQNAQTQIRDSIGINKKFDFKYQKLYIPTALMLGGIIVDGNGSEDLKIEIAEERSEHLFGFENHLDDYLQFAPFVATYVFDWAGMTPRTDFANRTAILAKGQILNLGMVYLLKKTLKETRPDGTAFSFPSGHTANVFAGATLLSAEYGDTYKWVPYAAYGVATGVGIMRMANNKHYISDVLFGAGLGIISMKIAYWTHQYQWGKKDKIKKDPLSKIYTFNHL